MSDNQENNPPRPSRSIRDRASRGINENSLPPTDYIKSENKEEKSENLEYRAKSYLSQLEENIEDEETDMPDINDYNQSIIKDKKPSVQILNLRNKRISTTDAKKQAKKDIEETVEKAKNEFKNVGSSINETKDELSKIGEKISQDTQAVKAKMMVMGLNAIEKIFNSPKEMVMGLFFKKKTVPKKDEKIEIKDKADDANKNKKEIHLKSIPRIKYANLIAKNIEFLTYDKNRLIGDEDSGVLLEQIFMANSTADLQYCVKYVTNLQQPVQGIYAQRHLTEIFENVTSDDINYFLYYVDNNPAAFVKTRYKFSEAFATWIIRKSHDT
ncbi:MAG: hypothetical protein H7263_05915 [Candidatus Sericytochromatia bacterium]|nr:hypothetical protein [Candidatus Sericytochromatia bacterium]